MELVVLCYPYDISFIPTLLSVHFFLLQNLNKFWCILLFMKQNKILRNVSPYIGSKIFHLDFSCLEIWWKKDFQLDIFENYKWKGSHPDSIWHQKWNKKSWYHQNAHI